MSKVARLDTALQRGLDNGFARVFGGRVVPPEIEELLKQEAEDNLQRTDTGANLAPNVFRIGTSQKDFQNLREQFPDLPRAFADQMGRFLRNQGWTVAGPVVVSIEAVEGLRTGQLRASSSPSSQPTVRSQYRELQPLDKVASPDSSDAAAPPAASANPPQVAHSSHAVRAGRAASSPAGAEAKAVAAADAGAGASESNDSKSKVNGKDREMSTGTGNYPGNQPGSYPGGYPSATPQPSAYPSGQPSYPGYPAQEYAQPDQQYAGGQQYSGGQAYPAGQQYASGPQYAGGQQYQQSAPYAPGQPGQPPVDPPTAYASQPYGGYPPHPDYQPGNANPAAANSHQQAGPAVSLLLQDGSSRTYPVHEGSNIIGRANTVDFRLPDTGVSRQHAEITWDGRDAVLVDLQSTNGTSVNGTPIENWLLADGDVITVGHSNLEVRITRV